MKTGIQRISTRGTDLRHVIPFPLRDILTRYPRAWSSGMCYQFDLRISLRFGSYYYESKPACLHYTVCVVKQEFLSGFLFLNNLINVIEVVELRPFSAE